MAEAIKIRATAHSFEGKVFTIVACSAVSEEIIAAMSADRPANRELLSRPNSAFSGVIDPHGNPVGEALIDEDRKSTRLNSSHDCAYRMPYSAGKKKYTKSKDDK